MQPVQIVLTDDHAATLAGALAYTRAHGDPSLEDSPEETLEELETLQAFMEQVALHPEAFPVTGQMAQVMTRKRRLFTGPAQPQSRRNKRKTRQAGRRAWQKVQRKQRRETAAAYNEARELMERELEEAKIAAVQDEQRIEQLLAQDTLASAELVELFELLQGPGVVAKIHELRTGEAAETPDIIVPQYSTRAE